MVEKLAESLLQNCPEVLEIFITKNIPENLNIGDDGRLRLIDNRSCKGFGENHNAAFGLSSQPLFCPLNPDIQLVGNPFPDLLSALNLSGAGLIAPIVRTPTGNIDDSVRRFPTLCSLLRKALGGADGRYSLVESRSYLCVEWVAGMFMLFQRSAFTRLGGFDEKFFLYYEDVDICVRAWKLGILIAACPRVSVIHSARRSSHHNLKHLRWHLVSMGRYFLKHWGRLPEAACEEASFE